MTAILIIAGCLFFFAVFIFGFNWLIDWATNPDDESDWRIGVATFVIMAPLVILAILRVLFQ